MSRYALSRTLADPEWGEPGYVTYGTPGEWPEWVLGDFEPAEPDEMLLDALVEATPEFVRVANQLRVGEPRFFFADLSQLSHVARYINGTPSAPLVALDPSAYRDLWGSGLLVAVRHTILHELGHAYLDSAGTSTHDEAEEETVERFARTGDFEALYRHG